LAKLGEGNAVVHLGLGYDKGSYEVAATTSGNTSKTASTTSRGTIVSFRDENRGLSNAYRLQMAGDKLGTGAYNATANNTIKIDKDTQGFEFAVAYGPFKFQGETANSKFNAKTTRYNVAALYASPNAELDADVKTQYIALVYNITGEDFAKSYSKGAFGGIKPQSEFMKDYGGVVGNGTGAWQVGYRYSTYKSSVQQAATIDSTDSFTSTDYVLNDGSTASGTANGGVGTVSASRYQNSPTANTSTYSLNWILNSNARVMFNYSRTKFGSPVEYLDSNYNAQTTTKEDIISVRTQINF